MSASAVVLRSALFNAWFLGTGFALSVAGIVIAHRPAQAMWLARSWARCTLWGLRALCRIHVRVEGMEHLTPGAALLACAHQSAFDTVIWHALLPSTAYVLKRELARLPFFGRLTLIAGMIPVDREGGAVAMRQLIRDGKRAAAAGRQIVIFPQGTRAAPGMPVVLQPGIAALALGTRLPVIPVITDSGLCWGRRAFRKQPGTIHIRLLPPLPAGLPRVALLSSLTDLFETAQFAPVDKPVPHMFSTLPSSGSNAPQTPAETRQ